MRFVGAFEAKNALGSLLDLVERGEEVVITRRGKPVARLVAEHTIEDRQRARQALEDLIEMRKGVSLGGLTVRELIDEGRE
ncbi:MAG: type II toxin-antitoxin system Phd/YefM family antitoxin [Phreatobacter sp.]|uniref:type II toxin-antitoxin system Phd/YefM family antitoxin n=1 Tax=Phreatobacter sp. TaxID=1966341 RepID=UPI001A38EA46|nr:type II toxin-antitoxin system Phd/YefM family antitoxin [Phreatobacter sp.]MBL8570067.1 type II toxin-antitoxin system Phd/YefM family antitoxin [Phreatobacter sp.]